MAALVGFSRLCMSAVSHCAKRIQPVILNGVKRSDFKSFEISVAGLRSQSLNNTNNTFPAHQQEVKDTSEEDHKITQDIIEKVDSQISQGTTRRLFAIVQVCGKQFKVTENDIIIIQGRWPPNIGDKLNLEKVLLVGSSDFTLIGRPILNREKVSIDATVVEKSLSHTKTHFRKKRRKQYMRINFCRIEHTMLRINSINLSGNINEKKDFEGLDRVF